MHKAEDECETGHFYRSEPEAGGLDSGRFGGLGEPPLFNGKGYDQKWCSLLRARLQPPMSGFVGRFDATCDPLIAC
jgi:hypothetical protein